MEEFDHITQVLQEGDIILYKSNDFLSKVINFFDESEYSHASLYIGNNKVLESRFRDGGVCINDISVSLKVYDKCMIRRHNDASLKHQDVIDYGLQFNGRRYDIHQILQLGLIGTTRKLKRRDNLFFDFLSDLLDLANDVYIDLFKNDDVTIICSELPYRCYNDLIPQKGDKYDIKLKHETTIRDGSRKSVGQEILKNGSLISEFYGSNASIDNLNIAVEDINESARAKLEEIIHADFQLDESIKINKLSTEPRRTIPKSDIDPMKEYDSRLEELEKKFDKLIATPEVTNTKGVNLDTQLKLKSNLDTFVYLFNYNETPEINHSREKSVQAMQMNLANYSQNRKHFVTTKDLRHALNLDTVLEITL